jgi:hypothetical protein
MVNKNPRRAATLCRDYENYAEREASPKELLELKRWVKGASLIL